MPVDTLAQAPVSLGPPAWYYDPIKQNHFIQMTKLFPTRSFTIVVGGRTYKFAPSAPCTAAQRRVLSQRHFADGWVAEIETKRDPHVIRRMNGRAATHKALGTDKELDLEFLCLEEAAKFLGSDGARAKRQGQVRIVDGLLSKARERFAGRFDEILIEGSDDPTCEKDLRAIMRAHSLEIAQECREFLKDVLHA